MALIHCIYASAASPAMSEREIPAIVAAARDKNERLGITGMLLYHRGSFFQVLEGEMDRVEAVFAAIRADERHQRVTLIIYEPIPERSFADWSMGYVSIQGEELREITGANDFFNEQTCLMALPDGRARRLLDAFGKGRWRIRLSGSAVGGEATNGR